MAIDRNKLLQNADKLVRQGKLDQAIAQYQQLMELSPRDMNLKNKVGDLLVRAERVPDAIKVFNQVAEFYAEEGFYLKAIAIYKKINKLDQTFLDCYYRLADLYSKQGLNNDAKLQFQQVADLYAKEGATAKAAEAIQQLLKLDPDNIKVRVRLAELYAKAGEQGKALDEYRVVGDELAKKSMFEEAIKIYEKGLAGDEGHAGLASGLVRALFELGRMDEVIERARAIYSRHRQNVGVLSVLADAYHRTNQGELARQVYEKLAALEPDNAAWKERAVEVRAPARRAAAPAAAATAGATSSSSSPHIPDLAEMSGDYSMEELEEVSGEWSTGSELAPDSGPGGAEPAPAALEGEKDEFILEHTTEAEVFIKYGLVEKAIVNLEAIVNHYPDEVESLRRLKDLHLETGNKAKAAERCVDLARIARARGEMQRALDLLAEARAHDPHVRLERGSTPATVPAEVPAAEAYSFGGPASVPVELDSGPPPSGVELQFDLGGGDGGAGTSGAGFDVPAAGMSLDFDLQEGGGGGGEAIEFSVEEEGGKEEAIEMELDEAAAEPEEGDLAEIDFYQEQGFADEARTRLENLRRRFPKSRKLRERLQALGPQAPAPAAAEAGGDEGIEFFDEAIRAPRREVAAVSEDLPFGPAPGGGAEEADDSLFAQETEFLSEAAEAPPQAEAAVGGGAGVGEDSLEEIFKEFKKGVEAQIDTEDYETHYNLGIAYKEMGLVDEAIAEFQLASKDPNRFLECCSHLGLCFREKGMPKLALKWYQKALDTLSEESQQYIAVLYDQGEAFEEAGDKEKALDAFAQVLGLDASYRDVGEKIRNLEG